MMQKQERLNEEVSFELRKFFRISGIWLKNLQEQLP